MFKIVDILNGQTVIDQIDRVYIETTMSQLIALENIMGFPQHFWLSEDFNSNDMILKPLVAHVQQYGVFIDADDDDIEDVNERGRYFGFERVDENATYHVSGTIKSDIEYSLKVSVYDSDVVVDDFCGLAFTDNKGYYKIPFNREDFSSFGPIDFEGLPELYLEIAELDPISGIFKTIKRLELPKTDETNIVRNIDLQE